MDKAGADGGQAHFGRTDLAEDRTVLANERTFASWVRTAMACIGVGLGFRALVRSVEPAWLAKAIATLFVLAGAIVLMLAYRRACSVLTRLDPHAVATLPQRQMRWLTALLVAGSVALAAVLWRLG